MPPSPCSPAAIASFLTAVCFAALFFGAAAAAAACVATQAGLACPDGRCVCVWAPDTLTSCGPKNINLHNRAQPRTLQTSI
eukprot:1156724-Pelagomonas_calceolata.AAC.3